MKLIDLSVLINNDTSVYPGDPKTKISQEGSIERDGYQDHYVCMGTHAGTHIDAPLHMLPGGKNIDQLPLDNFCGRGVYINVGKEITLEKIKEADIQEGDIVLLHTEMSDVYYKSEYYDNYPCISEEIADYLAGKKIKIIGVDMCSLDREPFPAHKIFLKNGILIIENLTNLEMLDGKEFRVYAFPLKLKLDGSPVRVVAEVN